MRSERILTFIDRSFVEIQHGSGLTVGEMLIADPKPEYSGGVAMAGADWAIRPGDLVPVSFELGSAAPGFYVPVEVIANLNERKSVFVVEDGHCREIVVTAHESSGTLRRIEGEGLVSGMQIVLEGYHYLRDGDAVDVVEVLELDQR
jgi:hypothetical protein